MRYIISYDISNSYSRKEISDFLISYNFIRIQKSVFLGKINHDLLEKFVEYLYIFLNNVKDSIIICPLNIENLENSYFLGITFDIDNFEEFKNFIIF